VAILSSVRFSLHAKSDQLIKRNSVGSDVAKFLLLWLDVNNLSGLHI